ncbi:LAMI_0F01024g1_1 [Lachancea mirantina]|uniref:LAMI_0F01024g1_1 n=1 Tax=Lachancea mirantina TaxID=1230905 RepID=A0A1G4JVQ0_9SACH|nr:LAMI_0F01024g1_1 [Lachancea mirantina]
MPVGSQERAKKEMKEAFVPKYCKRRSSGSSRPAIGSFDKVQLTKLLIDTLHEIGYSESARQLQKESGGVEVESSSVQKLFTAITLGRFEIIDLAMLTSLPLKHRIPKEHLAALAGSDVQSPQQELDSTDADLASKTTDWNRFFVNMQRQYKALEIFAKDMAHYDFETVAGFSDMLEVLVLVNREAFLELMFDRNETESAVLFLRTIFRRFIQLWESILIAQKSAYALKPDDLLKQMTSVMTSPRDSDEISSTWMGSVQKSRESLNDAISEFIDPNDLVPRGRLLTLLSQAVKFQNSRDILNFDDEDDDSTDVQEGRKYNLLQDNKSNSHRISFHNEKILDQNIDEIWYLEFSPDGKYLASASADSLTDRKVLIYDVENGFQIYKVLGGNDQCILYLSFSPDSRYLVSCPFNEEAKIYDIHKKGEPIEIMDSSKTVHTEVIQPEATLQIPDARGNSIGGPPRIWCCGWFHTERNKDRFVLGSPDRDVIIYDTASRSIICKLSDMDNSSEGSTQEPFPRIHDLKITRDDKHLILMAHEYFVDTYDLSSLPPTGREDESGDYVMDNNPIHLPRISRLNIGKRMTCISTPTPTSGCHDADPLLLINVQPHELQLWDIKEQILIQKYYGQRQLQFIIRSCFGYYNRLIASGSEDGKIYIWDRYRGNIIAVLEGHTSERPAPSSSTKPFGRNCNIVVWNPVDKTLFASGGDDGLIKIWRVKRK